jgi:hypothetical protein
MINLKKFIIECNQQGMEYLVKSLKRLDISYLLTKNINLDPVKIFFCQIRQHGGRNTNLTIVQSKSFFKTLLINNFVTRHSINANCVIPATSFLLLDSF